MDAKDMNQICEQMEGILTATTEAQAMATEANKKSGEIDTLVKASIEAAAKDAATQAEALQALKLQADAAEKTSAYVEKALSRLGGTDGGENESKEFSAKAGEQMARYLRDGTPIDQEVADGVIQKQLESSFFGVDAARKELEIKTLIAGSNADGGFFIRPERSATMIQRIFETSPIRSIANIETTTSDTMEFIIDDDEATSGGWVGEIQARPETATPEIGMLTIPVHEQYAEPKATRKMLQDAGFDIESWLSRKVTSKMTRFENTAFVTGDGSQKPKGFLQLPAWAVNGTYERGNIEQINSGAAGAFTSNGVKKLQNELIEAYQPNAVFGIKRASWEQIITLVDGNGQYLLEPRSLKTGDDLTLLGKRVIFMDDMPAIATDSLSMVYGDFGVGYTIVDRMGFFVIRDEVTDKRFVKFYTTKRTGAAPTSYESLKIQKLAV